MNPQEQPVTNKDQKIIHSSPSHLGILLLIVSGVGIISALSTYYVVTLIKGPDITPTPAYRQISSQVSSMTQKTETPKMVNQEITSTPQGKIYTNPDYKYSFQYPLDWNISASFYPKTVYLAKGYTFPQGKWGAYDLIAQEKDTKNMAGMSISNIDDASLSQVPLSQVASNWRQGEQTALKVSGLDAVEVHQLPMSGAGGGSILGNPHTLSVFVRNEKNETFIIQMETENLTLFKPIFDHLLASFTFTH